MRLPALLVLCPAAVAQVLRRRPLVEAIVTPPPNPDLRSGAVRVLHLPLA